MFCLLLSIFLQQVDSIKIDFMTNAKTVSHINFNAYKFVDIKRVNQEQMNQLKLEKIRALNVSGNLNNLEMNNFDSLRYLDISYTNITTLPKQLCNAKSLEIIKKEGGVIQEISDCLCSGSSLKILNTDGVFYSSLKTLEGCELLRNLNLFLSNDSLENLNSFLSIEKMKSLTHLGLMDVSFLNLDQRFKDRIESLKLMPKRDADIGNLVNEILTFKNLKHLEIILNENTFLYDLSPLENLETLIVRRFGSDERVSLLNFFYKMKKLRVIFDFTNLRECNLQNDLSVILTSRSKYSYFKSEGFRIVPYVDPVFISH
jgi:hypothetical protein